MITTRRHARTTARKLALLASAALLTGISHGALAAENTQKQNNTQTQNTEAMEPAGLSDIVVTATRRSENLQKVPVTISSFQGEALDALQISNPTELTQLVPGFTIIRTLAGNNSFLRGVGTTNGGITTEPPVALYIDGLYLQNSAAAVFSFNNIERIEVLKGPQGTLYGRNSTGGLIHVITREPDRKPTMDAAVGYANYQTATGNIYASTPITDTLSANFAGSFTQQDKGWGHNVLTGARVGMLDNRGAQAKLKWEPSAGTKISLRGFFDHTKTDQGVTTAIYPGSLGVDGTPYLGHYKNSARAPSYIHQTQWTASLKVEQDLGFADLTAITGYVHFHTRFLNVQNGIPGNPVTGQAAATLSALGISKTFSQEVQIASKASDSPFSWIVGAFYYHDNTKVRTDVYGTCIGTVCAGAPVPTRTTGFPHTRSYSGYADGTYKVTDTTKVTLGVRYTSDNKTLTGLAEPFTGRPNSPAALAPTAVTQAGQAFAGYPNGIDTDKTFSKLTFRAVLSQDVTEQIHAYASFNRGFKSGGYNPVTFTNPPSKPEVLDAYEAGVKSELFNNVLRLNVAAFYYDYKDIQLRSTAPPAPVGSSILYNAASAHIKGVDLDFTLAPAEGLTIKGGAEYLDAKYHDFPGGNCTSPRMASATVLGGTVAVPCDLTGKRLPSAPKLSFSLGATYVIETAKGPVQLAINDGYKSHFFWEPDNRLSQKAYHLVNASVGWTSLDERYGVQVFVRNLTGIYYYTAASVTGGNDVYAPGTPRTFGITLKYHY